MHKYFEFEIWLANFLPRLKTKALNWLAAISGIALLILQYAGAIDVSNMTVTEGIAFGVGVQLLTLFFQRLRDKVED
jgi:hypothetical protein